MSGDSTHAGAGDSPRPQRSENPYAELQAHLEDLEHFSHQALQQFPRAERFLLCAQIRESLLQIQRLSVVAWKRYHKKSTLQDLDVEVEILRKWITKSLRLGYITPKKHGTWLEIVNTIGRQVGGWIRATRQ